MIEKGYTLIELLLVITIITLLTSMSISFYHHQQLIHRAEKIAFEMQTFLAAALNYQNDTGHWPDANNNLSQCSSTTNSNDFIENYLPNGSAQSLFASIYCWSESNTHRTLFWLALELPPHNLQLAKHIVTLLPNALLTTNPLITQSSACDNQQRCYIKTEIVGSNNNKTSGTYIAGIGNCIPNVISPTLGSNNETSCEYQGQEGKEPKIVNYKIVFSCPGNMKGDLIASVNFLDVGKANGDPYVLRTLQFETECQQDANTANCILKINAARAMGLSVATGAQGHIGASYTAYCVPITKQNEHFSYSFR